MIDFVLDPELKVAAHAIQDVLEKSVGEDREAISPRTLIGQAMQSGVGEEAVRAALWELVDQRQIEFTPERQIRRTDQATLAL
jgi:hypothetical protein